MVDWVKLDQGRVWWAVVSTAMNLRVTSKMVNLLAIRQTDRQFPRDMFLKCGN